MSEALPVADKAEPVPPSTPRCYHCEAELAPGSPGVCAACGRRQTRVCFCGAQISRAVETCPHCGANWTRTRKRRRPSRHERRSELLTYAAIGGAISLGGALVAFLIWRSVMRTDVHETGRAISHGWEQLLSWLAQTGPVAVIGLAVFLVGAVGGLAIYYARRTARSSNSSGRRRVKRTASDDDSA